MDVFGRIVSSVATPFHPFGGAVDIIVVKQHDGSFRTTPWYVRFGKFQGVLKGAEKLVRIEVNGVEADFHMHLDNSGEAYFVSEDDPNKNDGDQGLVDFGNYEGRREDVDGNTDLNNVEDGNGFNGNSEVEVRDERTTIGMDRLERVDSDAGRVFYDFQDDESSDYDSSIYDNIDNNGTELESSQGSSSEVVLVSVDGHMLTARLSSFERNAENVQQSTPQFQLGPGQGNEEYNSVEATLGDDNVSNLYASESKHATENVTNGEMSSGEVEPCEDGKNLLQAQESASSPESTPTILRKDDVFKSCLELRELDVPSKEGVQETSERTHADEQSPACENNKATTRSKHVEFSPEVSIENTRSELFHEGLEISLCGKFLYPGMSLTEVREAFERNRLSAEEFRLSAPDIVKNVDLIVRVQGKYLPWDKAAHIILGKAAFGLDLPVDAQDIIRFKQETPEENEGDSELPSTPSRRWRLWPIPFRRAKSLEYSHSTASSSEDFFVDSESVLSESQGISRTSSARLATESPRKKIVRTNIPTTDQIASLNLQEGQNTVKFTFSTRVLGTQKVEAHIYLWKWNTRIVISDVDGTITKSDVLGQFMPLVGRDWSHSGIARLFSAIKENGYQLLFLSARAIVQSYLTKSFLFNLKQDGNSLPSGPVVISPDGLFPSLYREVIRRAPHEFKIACLEDIKALFPPNYNPFYAGFGNRDTDELSYRKIGIPNGKIFIINPKGEVAINRRTDVKSYTSLHTLVHDMFPPTSLANDTTTLTSLVEKEEYNDVNYWRASLYDD